MTAATTSAPERGTGDAVPALHVRGVEKRFADTRAVDGVDLDVSRQELLVLVGPSGCGKSTLLRLLAGLETIDAGRIELNGAVVDDGRTALPPERRRVGLVFQEHALFPHLTVDGNVTFGLDRLSRGDARRRAEEMLDMVGLAGYGDRYPHELSGGERQRVALARALAPAPDLLLLDEPFASLDTNLRTRVRADVVAILRATGTAAVFVTHDQAEAVALGDRVAVMRSGRMCQVGTSWEVFHRPADTFVAGFLGEADFLLIADGTTELGTPIPCGPGPAAVAMIRPDDVTFDLDDGALATVIGREFRGATNNYTLRLPSGTVVRSQRSHLTDAEVGDRVRVALKDGHQPVSVPSDEHD